MTRSDVGSNAITMSLATRLDKAQILLEADEFVTRYNLHDSRNLIRKGALLSYDPHDYARVDGLTDDEITALQDDKMRVRPQLFCALAGILYVLLSVSFRPLDVPTSWNPSYSNIRGILLVAIPLLEYPLAALLSNSVGRRQALCTASVLVILRECLAIRLAFFGYWLQQGFVSLVVDRLLAGLASATLLFNIPLHLAEYGPASFRGRLMMVWPITLLSCDLLVRSILASIPFGQYVAWIHVTILPIAALFIVSLPHMALESPYQFIPRGHMATSLQTLYKTRPAKIVAARDLYRIYAASSSESSLASQSTRRATISSITIMLIQALMIPPELLRVHLFNSYDTQDFARSIMSSSSSLALTAFSGVFRLIDNKRFGQRRHGSTLDKLYAITISVNSILRVFVQIRDTKNGFRHMDTFIYSWQAVQIFTVPVAFVIMSFLMRETANIPLEDMEKVFEARTRDIVLYQVKVAWPYLFKRYVLWRRKVVLEPFEESRYGTGAIALE
ncbi:hypothetical protein AbraIFM66950_009684 [Aspergillus brasiliensis]|nr:hypothetical protein AbraIFM66950_009684 [Aspergillus brasiliensis]